jgi:hypothetical protein
MGGSMNQAGSCVKRKRAIKVAAVTGIKKEGVQCEYVTMVEETDEPVGDDAVRSDSLEQAVAILDTVDPAAASLLAKLNARLKESRLQLAVLGQFKRGKSTFINALLGVPLLPTAVIPLTSIPTFISWGPKPLVRITFEGKEKTEESKTRELDDIRDFLHRFVAEEANPRNVLGVGRVDVFYPAPTLADGTVFIDTPGVGSTLGHNTDSAYQALSESDAAFFVLSAEPPLTEDELAFLRRLRASVSQVFFILNKIDHLGPDDRKSVVQFTREVLSDNALITPSEDILCISARDALQAKLTNDAERFRESGVAAVEEQLIRYLKVDKKRWLEDAIGRKSRNILFQAAGGVELRIRALKMPIDELTSKLAMFEEALRSIDNQRVTSRDLLAGDRRRLTESLESDIEALRERASFGLIRAIEGKLSSPSDLGATQLLIEKSIESTFEDAEQQLASRYSQKTRGLVCAHEQRIAGLVDEVRRAAADIFDILPEPAAQFGNWRPAQEPYWVTRVVAGTMMPDPRRLIDRFLPPRFRRARIRTQLVKQARELVVRNAENLRWSILRELDDGIRRISVELEDQVEFAVASVRGAITNAVAQKQSREIAVAPETERLNRTLTRLKDAIGNRIGV